MFDDKERVLNETIYLRIDATVEQASRRGCGLTIHEQVELHAQDFLELAKILGQFHDLAQKLSAAHSKH